MTDLTPKDVRNKRGRFHRSVRGYEPGEVDAFLGRIADQLFAFSREKDYLLERIARLEERLAELEGREETIQETLLFAHKVSEQTIEKSRKDAELLRERTRMEAALMKAEAERDMASRMEETERLLRDRKEALEELERFRVLFLRSLKKLLEREISTVEVEAARKPLEDITLRAELQEWIPSAETPTETEAGRAESVRKEEKDLELGGSKIEPEGDVGVAESGAEGLQVGPGEGVGEGERRRTGAFDYMVTSVKEEALPELFGRLLDGGRRDRESPTRGGRAGENEEEDT